MTLFEMFLVTCCLVHAVHVARFLASNIMLEASKMLPSICLYSLSRYYYGCNTYRYIIKLRLVCLHCLLNPIECKSFVYK